MTRDLFVGTWRLVSYELRGTDGQTRFPFGQDPAGYIMYSDEGYVSAALMSSGRTSFASGDWEVGTPGEYREAVRTYVSYCGRYEVLPDRVIHHVELSLFPNWCSTGQERFYEFEGDRLELSTPPILLGGIEQTAHLVWDRVPSAA